MINMGVTIGIDLGTTNSAIAYLKNNRPEIIPNERGERTTPSVVSINNGNILIGTPAKNMIRFKPDNVISEIKRKMGNQEKITLDGREYTPEEISAFIIKYLIECAEDYLGEKVEEAVITVPANFNDLQRRATMNAADIAGVKVERIINEPTAAALAYGLDHYDNDENILVYDLGGGTFDVTILEFFDGIFDIQGGAGDNYLGGSDFDQLLLDYIINEFKDSKDIDLGKYINERIFKETAEEIKIELSSAKSHDFSHSFTEGLTDSEGNPISTKLKVSRAKFEELVNDLVARTVELTDKALEDAELSAGEIDTVLVVGGSTRVPLVREVLENKFGTKVRFDINPDEAIALGAAIQAAIKADQFTDDKDPIITDVCYRNLGVEIVANIGGRLADGVFDILIEKNTTIPASNKKIYSTIYDNQTSIDVRVFEGDDQLTVNNTQIDEFSVNGIPSAPVGQEEIEIEFQYNINGKLVVNVTIVSTDVTYTKMINFNSMTQEEVAVSREKILSDWKKSALSGKVEAIIESAENKKEELDKADADKVDDILKKLKMALIDEDEVAVDRYEEELTNLLFDLM